MSLSRQARRKKQRAGTYIDTSKMNKGGYYKGMPGVTLDEWGNRRLIQLLVTEEGEVKTQVFAHNKMIKLAIQDQLGSNPMLRAVFRGAVVDDLFSWKNPLNWPLRIRYNLWYRYNAYKHNLKLWWQKRKLEKKLSINKDDK